MEVCMYLIAMVFFYRTVNLIVFFLFLVKWRRCIRYQQQEHFPGWCPTNQLRCAPSTAPQNGHTHQTSPSPSRSADHINITSTQTRILTPSLLLFRVPAEVKKKKFIKQFLSFEQKIRPDLSPKEFCPSPTWARHYDSSFGPEPALSPNFRWKHLF